MNEAEMLKQMEGDKETVIPEIVSLHDIKTKDIVASLDKFIVSQKEAKRVVAIALRSRWRRMNVPSELRKEIVPNNILMIGPTGVGKTEIARRLADLVDAPFLKVEATKFTEVGYVGRDVEQIIRDLLEIAVNQTREAMRKSVQFTAYHAVENVILDALLSEDSSIEMRQKFLDKLRSGDFEETEVEIDVPEVKSNPVDMSGASQQIGMINLNDVLGKAFNANKKKKPMKIKQARRVLLAAESDKLIDESSVIEAAINKVETTGIVFLDEIDKLCTKNGDGGRSSDVSREGVQRDLLPIVEGTTVSCKYGQVKTDYILFIASGSFHLSSPSDLLPELQGRLPVRVELKPLTQADFVNILTGTSANLIKQYQALLKVDNVSLTFTNEAINEIARTAVQMNESIENIGARRLKTVLEKVLDDVSFDAPDELLTSLEICENYVREKIGKSSNTLDLSKFIL
jgi:ATP-dependent HslUV protease ATP-binding subunit HslU